MASADRTRKVLARIGNSNGLAHLPVASTNGTASKATMMVRIAMARSASMSRTPALAKTAVSAAKQADSAAQTNHAGTLVLIIYPARG